jgi:integrase
LTYRRFLHLFHSRALVLDALTACWARLCLGLFEPVAVGGLRVSELLALRWMDVDFENLELRVTRSIWHQVVGDCKTEASAKPVPMDSYMAGREKRTCAVALQRSEAV